MSNLSLEVEGVKYNGVAVKLVDGLMITFDGRMIRHGTTICDHVGPIHGFHIAANGISMRSKERSKREEQDILEYEE